MVTVFPAIWWNWTPPVRMIAFSDDLLGNLGVLGTYFAAATMRMTRTMMLLDPRLRGGGRPLRNLQTASEE